MKINGIQAKLVGFTVIAITFAAVVPLFLSFQEQKTLFAASVYKNFDGLSGNMANRLVAHMDPNADEFILTTQLLELEAYEHIRFARVYDANWHNIAQYVNPRTPHHNLSEEYLVETLVSWNTGMHFHDSDVVALKLIGDPQLPLGYLLIVNDFHKPLIQSARTLLNRIVPFASIIVLALCAAAVFNYKILLLPLVRLSKFAKEVEATGNYSLRISATGSDEVSDLTDNINKMMITIDAKDLENHHKNQQVLAQQKAMEQLAKYDSLTGLPNRYHFISIVTDAANAAAQSQSDIAIMFLDIDDFKNVNDTLGHDIGDLLLIEITREINRCLSPDCILSRLSGDEFLLLIPNPPNKQHLSTVATNIIQSLSQPITLNSLTISTSVSIGISTAKQTNYKVNELLSNADIAMYRSKLAGKNGYTFFREDMLTDYKRKLAIAGAITDSLNDGEFYLKYQPKVSSLRRVVGFEALARWNHPILGKISPVEFIPAAERSGQINKISAWVLNQICADYESIRAAAGKSVVISMNLSALDIRKEHFLSTIEDSLSRYHINPQNIEFEVTESAYLENFDNANHIFKAISNMGCRIALDDFGTGYSSLSYLTQLHLDTLKIDKLFVDGIGTSRRNTQITRSIIEMAKNLNLEICAEGVETNSQSNFLFALGCNYIQGYFFGKPVVLEQIAKEITRIQRDPSK